MIHQNKHENNKCGAGLSSVYPRLMKLAPARWIVFFTLFGEQQLNNAENLQLNGN